MRLTGQKLYGVPIIVQPTMAEKNRLAAQAQNLMKQEGPRKVYVGNLSPSITDGMLKKIFEPFGNIEKLTVQRDDGGKSKGFGFIEVRMCVGVAYIYLHNRHSMILKAVIIIVQCTYSTNNICTVLIDVYSSVLGSNVELH